MKGHNSKLTTIANWAGTGIQSQENKFVPPGPTDAPERGPLILRKTTG